MKEVPSRHYLSPRSNSPGRSKNPGYGEKIPHLGGLFHSDSSFAIQRVMKTRALVFQSIGLIGCICAPNGGPFSPDAWASSTSRDKNWVNQRKCNGVSVLIRHPKDAIQLMELLPVTSESLEGGSLSRSIDLGSQHESIRLECMVSTYNNGVCSLIYVQTNVKDQGCQKLPTQFSLSRGGSSRIISQMGDADGFDFETADGVFTLQCITDECQLTVNP